MLNTTYDYTYYDSRQQNPYNRCSIDGTIVGCGKCIGYCQFEEHRGFLTKKQRQEHNCIGKGCYYYLPKPKFKDEKISMKAIMTDIIRKSSEAIADFEGIKIIRAEEKMGGELALKYVTLTNGYSIQDLERLISSALGQKVIMQKLNYDFEIAAQLIYS